MQPARGTDARSAADAGHTPDLPLAGDVALNDVLRDFGERWEIARITGGYRAIIRDTGGHTPIPRYGRTPAELAESIRMVERQPAFPESCGDRRGRLRRTEG
jgi:hypothetical protein